jgi:toxin FitB
MSFLIETDVLAHARRKDRVEGKVAAWLNACEPGRAFLSALTVFELEQSCETMLRRDLRQGAMFRLWLNRHVMPAFEGRILPLDAAVARIAAGLQAANTRPERAALMAATALCHKFSIVTGQARDFAGTGVKLINPWGE